MSLVELAGPKQVLEAPELIEGAEPERLAVGPQAHGAAESALGIDIDGVSGASPYGGEVTVVLGNVDGGAPDLAMVLLNTHTINQSDLFFGS